MRSSTTDRAVADLAAAHDRLAAALYTVDVHPTHALLRGIELRGVTAQVWAGVRVDRLWAGFVAARDVLERLRALGGRTRDADAARILAGAVPVDPLDGLPDLPPAAFVADLERQCADAAATLDRVAAARAGLTDRLIELDTALDAATRPGSAPGPAVEALRSRLQQVYEAALRDPLSDGGTAWTTLREDVARAVRHLTELRALRAALPARLARLNILLDALGAAERAARRARARAVEKIADPGLPDPADVHDRWRAAVTDAVRATDDLDLDGWPALDRRLAALDRDLTAAVTAAEDRDRAATGLLDRREELRGRLEAYRAKAVRLDRVEEPGLTSRYRTARELLWTAPCDLRAATRAVFAYQQALSGAAEGSAT